jgi:hypothetical protein
MTDAELYPQTYKGILGVPDDFVRRYATSKPAPLNFEVVKKRGNWRST